MSLIHSCIYIGLIALTNAAYSFSLMLDPAGDAKRPGRIVHDTFERGITLQYAEQLKKKLESLNPSIRTILTRFPGETVEDLQNAHFANRLAVDLYISIHFYQESETKPNLFLYYVSYNDSFITKSYDLCFYPYDQAHRINAQKTINIAQCMAQTLSATQYNRLYQFCGCFGLPIKPLIGIKSPAILLEASIKKSSDWHVYVEPIAQAIIQCMKQYETP